MADKGQFVAGWFTPLEPNLPSHPDRPEGGWGGKPIQPLPPLPPVDPPIDPPEVGPGTPEHPIFLPDKPNLPPGFVWPPFDPSEGIEGKVLLLVWVPGSGKKKWIVVDVPSMPGTWPPEGWQPPAGGIGGTPPPRPGGGPQVPEPKSR